MDKKDYKTKYLGAIPRQLSDEDKLYIKLIGDGKKKAPSFREAYPSHPQVMRWNQTEPGSPDHQRAAELVIAAAKNKLQAKYMRGAIITYQDKMAEFAEKSIDSAIDLVENARSEKVRADLAIEGMRHQVGTPVQKIAVKEDKTVYLTFEKPKPDPIEGEVV